MISKLFVNTIIISTIILTIVSCDKATDPPQASIPVLTTTEVTGITSSSVTSGGNIASDGRAVITARGVCWSTNSNPTINDNITSDGTGTGNFTSTITGLTSNTTYYVRAYATNSAGTGYGNSISFATTSSTNTIGVPLLTTTEVTGITSSSATSGGNITSDGGAAITARGVCWSTNSNPIINDNKTTDGTGIGGFTSTITGLAENTLYTIRAYATNNSGTGYGSPRTIYTSSLSSQLAYLGQTPPGRTLQPFAPNIIGNWNHAEVTVSPDGQEIYWTSRTAILYSKLQNGNWTPPQIVPFSGQGTENYYDDVPVVSPDNKKLFFLSKRPIGYATNSREHIWYVERTTTGWSEPIPLPQNVNSTLDIHWQLSITNDGTIYFGAFGGIFITHCLNGEYTDPVPLQVINEFGNVTCPFISPDESYLIFCKIVSGIGDLYITFKDVNGQWRLPQSLNNIGEVTSFVSRDGRYLFAFHNWISAEIIDDLKPH